MLGGEQRRLSFLFPDGRCVWTLLGRLEDPVDDHRVRVRLPVGKHRALRPEDPLQSTMVAFQDVVEVFHTCRCSTVGGQIPSDFNSAIALAREGALSVLITLGYPADALDLTALTRKHFAAATFGFGER